MSLEAWLVIAGSAGISIGIFYIVADLVVAARERRKS